MVKETVVIAVVCFVAVNIAVGVVMLARHSAARHAYAATIRAVRWWMLPGAIAHVFWLLCAVSSLMNVPLLQYGWWMLLGGSGNIMLGQTGQEGFIWQTIGLAVPLAIFVVVPLFAHSEEMHFRYAAEADSISASLRRQTVFGLIHLVAGIPLAAGIALIGSGLIYERVYLRALSNRIDDTEFVEVTAEPRRLDYPPTPQGPYDAAAWDDHRVEFERVAAANSQLLDDWVAEYRDQQMRRQVQIDGLRETAVTTAAAFHSCSNWLVISVLIAYLLLV